MLSYFWWLPDVFLEARQDVGGGVFIGATTLDP